jgi:hypothetical protein
MPGHDRHAMWITKEELLGWQPARDVAKPYPAAPATARAKGTP